MRKVFDPANGAGWKMLENVPVYKKVIATTKTDLKSVILGKRCILLGSPQLVGG